MADDIEPLLVAPVKYFVYLVSLAIWAIVGFIFWIPVLVRSTASFSAAILYATLTGTAANHIGAQMNAAISFYFRGFNLIRDAMFAPRQVADELPPFRLLQFISEALWAALFWGIIVGWLLDIPIWHRLFSPFFELFHELRP